MAAVLFVYYCKHENLHKQSPDLVWSSGLGCARSRLHSTRSPVVIYVPHLHRLSLLAKIDRLCICALNRAGSSAAILSRRPQGLGVDLVLSPYVGKHSRLRSNPCYGGFEMLRPRRASSIIRYASIHTSGRRSAVQNIEGCSTHKDKPGMLRHAEIGWPQH